MDRQSTSKRNQNLRSFGMAVVAATFLFAAEPTHAQGTPDGFVKREVDQGIGILANKSLGDADRRAQIETLLASLLDMRRMALFTLGPAARTAPPADVEAFVEAYRTFALANYESQLGAYNGQMLQVKGAKARGADDYVVTAFVLDPNDKAGPPTEVDFRVLGEGGKFAVVDASVEGVWFTLAQREDFMSFLSQNGGSVPKLVDHLKALAAHPQSGSAAASGTP
jgi:phospholipid transport system substrate-binding protein